MRGAMLLGLLLASSAEAQSIRPERTSYKETSSHADVLGFLDSLGRVTSDIRITTLTRSPEGRRVPWVLAARPVPLGPAEAHRSGKPIVYLQANIHGGEVEGKEAAQMLLRDLTHGGLSRLLDSLVLLVVPIYNADGNDHMGP
ncbi:MAG: M14 family zinc carboxypeptidase, partial [Gemmatimonadales bacterium]